MTDIDHMLDDDRAQSFEPLADVDRLRIERDHWRALAQRHRGWTGNDEHERLVDAVCNTFFFYQHGVYGNKELDLHNLIQSVAKLAEYRKGEK